MLLFRKIRDTNETDTLPEVFNCNLSNIPSEIEDVDDCVDDSRDDSTVIYSMISLTVKLLER